MFWVATLSTIPRAFPTTGMAGMTGFFGPVATSRRLRFRFALALREVHSGWSLAGGLGVIVVCRGYTLGVLLVKDYVEDPDAGAGGPARHSGAFEAGECGA